MIDVNELNRFLGTDITSEEVEQRLQRYGFSVEKITNVTFNILVPTHRMWDVHTVFDIYEEIAKSIGYNAIPTTWPKIDKGALPSRLEKHRDLVESLLIGTGFVGSSPMAFMVAQTLINLGYLRSPLTKSCKTQNSLDKGYSLLKNNCLLQAVDCVRKNMP